MGGIISWGILVCVLYILIAEKWHLWCERELSSYTVIEVAEDGSHVLVEEEIA